MILINFLLIFLLIALNGFFVAVEFSAVTSRRSRLDLLDAAGSRPGQIVRSWLESPAARDRLIAASQLGITVVSLALGALGENTFQALLEPYFQGIQYPQWAVFLQEIVAALPLVLSLIVVTTLHVVLGEQVPKVAVLRSPERFALWAAPFMQGFSRAFRGFVHLLDHTTRLVLSILGIPRSSSHTSTYSLEEVRQMVTGPEVEHIIEEPEREMLGAVIDFGELIVRQVAIPRTGIIAVEADAPASEAIRLAVENSITKLPVYEENLDHIVGIAHLHDLVGATQNCIVPPITRTLAREALFVPENISVNDLLHQFRTSHNHMGIVLDEFGGTAGLVTLTDLLDEIFGEVQDALDTGLPSIQPQTDGSALVDGMTLIEEVNEYFNLTLIDPNYDTIAGYILGKLGYIPGEGDLVEDHLNGVSLRAEKMDQRRIAQVRLKRI